MSSAVASLLELLLWTGHLKSSFFRRKATFQLNFWPGYLRLPLLHERLLEFLTLVMERRLHQRGAARSPRSCLPALTGQTLYCLMNFFSETTLAK